MGNNSAQNKTGQNFYTRAWKSLDIFFLKNKQILKRNNEICFKTSTHEFT